MLHGELNEKIRKIRDAFETYEGNTVVRKGSTGLVTDRFSCLNSTTRMQHPSPVHCLSDSRKAYQGFIDSMDEVLVVEHYPAIELQIPDRSKVQSGFVDRGRGRPQFEERIQGFYRDT